MPFLFRGSHSLTYFKIQLILFNGASLNESVQQDNPLTESVTAQVFPQKPLRRNQDQQQEKYPLQIN